MRLGVKLRPAPGAVLHWAAVGPAIILLAWLVAGLPLLAMGVYRPLPAVALAAALLVGFGPRLAPRRGVLGDRAHESAQRPTWRNVIGVASAGLFFLVFELLECSEEIIVGRDPSTYAQSAIWLTKHGALTIPTSASAFGGDHALTYASAGFYEQGGHLVPQFMPGWPIILSAGGWIGGVAGVLVLAPVLGAAAVVGFGGLAARLVGPRWAALGAWSLALCLPMLYVARSTFSEPAEMVLIFGGLLYLLDLGPADPRNVFGGLMLGSIVVIRIDGLRDVLPVLLYAGVLIARRQRAGWYLGTGVLAGAAAGFGAGLLLSGPYLRSLRGSLEPLSVIVGAVVLLTCTVVAAQRFSGAAAISRRLAGLVTVRRLPALAAASVVVVMAAFAVRPMVQKVVRTPTTPDDKGTAAFVARFQHNLGLPIEPDRLYYEYSLHWVGWYVGVPVLIIATTGAALIARDLCRGRVSHWWLPFLVIAWSTMTTLWRPAITPDQPWASRRLIALVIPGMLLFALWVLSRFVAWSFERLPATWRTAGVRVAVFGGVAVILGPILSASVLMIVPVEQGEVGAVRGMCARLGAGTSVLVLQAGLADEFSQVIRGECGRPVARIASPIRDGDVQRLSAEIRAAGRTPAVIGSDSGAVAPYGPPVRILHLRIRRYGSYLLSAPKHVFKLDFDVWMSRPGSR